jgi:shikimate kinase
MRNIILIGMPGSGKSTIGVVLAKTLGLAFIDTDLLIQQRVGKRLQELIEDKGRETFLKTEEEVLQSLTVKDTVIATGGSAIYSEAGMNWLSKNGTIVYLELPFEEVEKRIRNVKTRGIVMPLGMTLKDLYLERVPLYQKRCDVKIDCANKSIEDLIEELHQKFSKKVL